MEKVKLQVDSDLLFVYGTLRMGHENPWAVFLRKNASYLGVGKMRGRKFSLGEYPGAIHDEMSDGWLEGDVFWMSERELIFKQLDEYEGVGEQFPQPHEYVRKTCPVELSDKLVQCWVYLYNG